MSGEKTEQPTEKRLRDARKKGQVAKSQDLTSALMLLTAVIIFWLGGTMMAATLLRTMKNGIETAASFKGVLTQERAMELLTQGAVDMGTALAPWFIFMFLGAILYNYIQVGSMFAVEGLKPELNKLNPAEGFSQKFLKPKQYVELGKTLLKSLITFTVVATVLYAEIPNIAMLLSQPAESVVSYLFALILKIGFYVGLMFVGLAVGDYFLQRFLFLNQMKMSKQEVKQEYKESEGDPLIKWMRKNIHREILSQSSIAAVSEADVVVVNPTHVAVALKYDRARTDAPLIVAKGADLIAKQIREIAKKNDVPMMRDIPLARALYEIEIDGEVPEELYETVAEVLRWVYSLNESKKEH
ncbi:MAG: flagellar biosynthesis protein FlhB [Acidobacteriota bacterium]|nr:flagellar biosynthesis protein FlhB [Acidobacteriota bacterium]